MTDKIKDVIITETSNRLDTEFLNHLSRGGTGYRSLHNLTHEVGNQYRGRFLVELLQNAHDALPAKLVNGSPARVAMILESDEEEYGVLYVANDGEPFSISNFRSLSQLAQSDKDPETNIGNKGIGFRSVLEISAKPQIFSRSTASSSEFDGYCFGFDPEFITNLIIPILSLAQGDDNVVSPLDRERVFVDWDQRHLKQFRSKMVDRERFLEDLFKLTKKSLTSLSIEELQHLWLQHELRYLSPYLFPLPMNMHGASNCLLELQSRNFASVIRLPLKSGEARQAVIDKMGEFSATTVMFLDRITELSLTIASDVPRTICRREKIGYGQPFDTTFISIRDSLEENNRRYVLWKECIRTSDDSFIAEAIIKELPEQWHSLQEITISVASPTGLIPEQGLYSVYLPTLQPSGCGAYINAPFYAKLDRTGVDFKYKFNNELANRAASLAVRVSCEFLLGGKTIASRAAVDLMTPWPCKEGEEWFAHIDQASKEHYKNLEPIDLVYFATDDGWQSPNHSSLIPVQADLTVVSPSMLRMHAESIFNAISEKLDGRRAQIENLYEYLGDNIPSGPMSKDLAKTMGAVANTIFDDLGATADWNGFLRDLIKLLPDNLPDTIDELKKEKIFLGTDGALHASNGCTIFFRKVRGVDEDDNHHGDVGRYPLLQQHVAFLNQNIDFTGPEDHLYRYLNGRFVQIFRVENVLEKVLCRITPPNPVLNKHEDSKLCEQILKFAIELTMPLYLQGNAQSAMPHFRKLRVPCRGGWYRMFGASFGPGWSATIGHTLAEYFESVNTPYCQIQRKMLLIRPSDDKFGTSDFSTLRRILSNAGVMNGIRLVSLTPDKCGGDFGASRGSLNVPSMCPELFTQAGWETFRNLAKNYEYSEILIKGWRNYQLKGVVGIPGFEEYEKFNETTKELFLNLILESLPCWTEDWKQVKVSRSDGMGSLELPSPLLIALSITSWLPVHHKEKSKDQQVQKWQRPDEGWLIPASILDGRTAWHYAHLTPFRKSISERIDFNPQLRLDFSELGLPIYNPGGSMSDSRLLDRLARTVNDDSHDLPLSILVGQVREAWKLLKPKDTDSFPDKLIYRSGSNSKLFADEPAIDRPFYLPDSNEMKAALEMNESPIIEIKPGEAKNLRKEFQAKYGERIRLSSKLALVPLVGGEIVTVYSDELLADSDLDWLAPVLLTLVAHYGDQEQGVKSLKFIESLETLQVTRISWVPDLSLGLSYGDESISGNPQIPAFWLDKGKDKVLLLAEVCRKQFFLASDALAKLLDREDLRFPLRLMLKEFESLQPEPEHIIEALAHIEVDEDNYREALDHWNTGQGLGQLIHLLQPFVMALDKSAKMEVFTSLTSREHLLEFLVACNLSGLSVNDFLEMAHLNPNPRVLGSVLYERLRDEKIQLAVINECRKKLRTPELENKEAAAEFRAHINEVHLPLHGLIAAIAARKKYPGGYSSLAGELLKVQCPIEFSHKYWQVELRFVLAVLAENFKEWGASETELSAFSKETINEFESALQSTGIVFDDDPQTKAQKNRLLFKTLQARIEQSALAWLLKYKIDCEQWLKAIESLPMVMTVEIENNGYLSIWGSEDVFAFIKSALLKSTSPDGLIAVFNATLTIEDFEEKLGLTKEELSNAQKDWEEQKEKEKRRRRQVDVCGKPFDPDEDNLANLMNHINENFAEENLDTSSFNLDRTVILDNAKSRVHQDGGKGRSLSGKVRGGKETANDRLVGFAGEIYVYRMLEKKYGKQVIHSGVWKSSYSKKAFENNPCDDDLGYDFSFKVKSKNYHIEVKASGGNDSSFRLGTSEVRIARKLAAKKIKNDVFQIVHVLNALSETPSFHVLPNPFEDKYRDKFELSDADVWVRYREKKAK